MLRKIYSWRGVPNFGDRLTDFLLDQLDVRHESARPADADLVMVGSILEHLPPRWNGTVLGAGKLHGDTCIDLKHANVVALRGHLTAERVSGLDRSYALGDPGLLVSDFVRQTASRYDLGIVPHWSDTELAQRYPYAHVIDVRGKVWDTVSEIAKCRRIISSSLHGLIVADSFGIPRQAELFARAEHEGGEFKYLDYASVFDGDPHFGEMWRAPYGEVERIKQGLRTAIYPALNRAVLEPTPEPKRRRGCPLRKRPQISLLVPFRDDGEHRSRVWDWIRRYWHENLESVEIIQGHDTGYPFSKAAAVNDAAGRARGRIFAVLDADAYLDARHVQLCADAIEDGVAPWFIPYRHLYRLSHGATLALLRTDPVDPYALPSPVPEVWREDDDNASHVHTYGHKFGALIQMMPREAFFAVGGMDPRFRGWGSEDASFLRSLDTIWGQHEVMRNDVCHLWHARPGDGVAARRWVGQSLQSNSRLAQRYAAATGEPAFMAGLAQERQRPTPRPWWR